MTTRRRALLLPWLQLDRALLLPKLQLGRVLLLPLLQPGLLLRLPAGTAAPLTVSAWQGDVYSTACGTVVVPDALGTYLSLRAYGNVTLKWTAPGKGARSQSLAVENKTRAVTLP